MSGLCLTESRFSLNKFTDCQMNYLSMIQDLINRMSTFSLTIKGFASTIFAGVLAIVIAGDTGHQIFSLVIAMAMILVSAFFDCYYFMLEKQYRRLFDEVRLGNHECNFDLTPQEYSDITILSVLKRRAFWVYYGFLEALLIVSILYITTGVL